MERKVRDRIQEAVQAYGWEHCLLDAVSYGSGHINDTYLLTLGFSGDSGAGQQKDGRKVILQKMNFMTPGPDLRIFERLSGKMSAAVPLRWKRRFLLSWQGRR